ncbi:MAG: hypothetical protein SF187_29750 [Deltaproteobacteria bacterium]|nr:hypothetical protein [Deltaproteobacteria bacterium]
MISLYFDVAKTAGKRAIKAWPVAFSVLIYAAIMAAAMYLFGSMGMIGGFIMGFIMAGCFSSYLTLLDNTVSGHKSRWADLKSGFGARFWDVISVMFAFWVLGLASRVLVNAAQEKAPAMQAIIGLVIAVFFNVVPELLYQGSTRSFALLMESGRFITKNWMSWFPPNLLFAAVALAPQGMLWVDHPGELLLLFNRVFSTSGPLLLFARVPLWLMPLPLLFLHFVMVYRGVLFKELAHSNPRLRAFREAQRRD